MEFPEKLWLIHPGSVRGQVGWGLAQEIPPLRYPQEQPSTLIPFSSKDGIFISWFPRESLVSVLLFFLTYKGTRDWIDP